MQTSSGWVSNSVDLDGGIGPTQTSTIPGFTLSSAATTTASSVGTASSGFLGEPFAFWLVFVILLFVAKWVSEGREGKLLGTVANVKVGGYNWVVIGISSVTFIILMKLLFNSSWVGRQSWLTGATTLFNAV